MVDPLSVVRKVGEKSFILADELLQQVEDNGEQLIKEENSELGYWMNDAAKYLN